MNLKSKIKDKYKYSPLSITELIVILIGFFVFTFQVLENYKVPFLIFIVLGYWFRVKYIESKIKKKQKKIYEMRKEERNKPIKKELIEGNIEVNERPLSRGLNELKRKRDYLVDKFVIINLIILILVQIFK